MQRPAGQQWEAKRRRIAGLSFGGLYFSCVSMKLVFPCIVQGGDILGCNKKIFKSAYYRLPGPTIQNPYQEKTQGAIQSNKADVR